MLVRSTYNRVYVYASQNVRQLRRWHIFRAITTGKRITKLSDDPATSNCISCAVILIAKNVTDSSDRATTILNTVEYALTSAITLTDRAKCLPFNLVMTISVEQRRRCRRNLADEGSFKEVANTDFHGRYVFAGQGYIPNLLTRHMHTKEALQNRRSTCPKFLT